MIWKHALATHKTDPAFTIPEEFYKTFANQMIPFLGISLLQLCNHLDCVVLIGFPQEGAMKRRTEGKHSWIVESPFYNSLSAWFGYFVEKVYPKLYEKLGTGILILDGGAPLEQNAERLITYLRKLVSKQA